VYVLRGHLLCAAYEIPLTAQDEEVFGSTFPEAVDRLLKEGRLKHRVNRWYYPATDYPAQQISIRALSDKGYQVLDESQDNALLEDVESATAFRRIHPGAVHLHQGESYLITDLDLRTRVARARPAEVGYYTQPREVSDLAVVRPMHQGRFGKMRAWYGQVEVTEQVVGYRRKQLFTDTVLGEEQLDLPSRSFVTAALWFDVPPAIEESVRRAGLDFQGGLHATEHAAIGILPLFAMCDRQDIGGLSTSAHPDTGKPQVFIYDAFPGGVGIAEKGFQLLPELWEATLRTIEGCPCEAGCPSCIHSPKCGNNNEPLDKAAAVTILGALLALNMDGAAPARV
jgi:DEAD/DEAH box helicase domain-containing protein